MRSAARVARDAGAASRRLAARALAARRLDLTVEGLHHVPSSGPALLAARHYHHLYDGVALLATIPREVHLLVAMDWVPEGLPRRAMQGLTAAARWPTVWRSVTADDRNGTRYGALRQALALSLELLREGELLAVFPEGYPVIAPEGARAPEPLPFASGFASLAFAAARAGLLVPIIPVGLAYARRASGGWSVQLRFGEPLTVERPETRAAFVNEVQARVLALSAP